MTKKPKTKQERERVVQMTLFGDEKDLLDEAASVMGLSTAAFVRSKAIDAAREELRRRADPTATRRES